MVQQSKVNKAKVLSLWETVKQLMVLMTKELEFEKDIPQVQIIKNLRYNFLLIAEREMRKTGNETHKKGADFDYVILFKDLLETGFQDKKTVSHYAKSMFITEKRLNQATNKILGKTPKEIIDNRIVLEAQRLLAHTSKSVKEIGFDLGYEEPTNFIKYLKKHNDLTLLEFRERFRTA